MKNSPGEEELKTKISHLSALFKLAEQGLIDLYFGDESGFSLSPYLPYAWHPVGEQKKISTHREHLTNVLGMLNPFNDSLITYFTSGKENIDTAFMVSRLNEFVKTITKETMLVLDNAPWHRSKEFEKSISEWQEKGLYIFLLPAYSPHLNLIETLWRKIKYEWLRPSDYFSKNTLMKRLKEIVSSYGGSFNIKFSLNIYM